MEINYRISAQVTIELEHKVHAVVREASSKKAEEAFKKNPQAYMRDNLGGRVKKVRNVEVTPMSDVKKAKLEERLKHLDAEREQIASLLKQHQQNKKEETYA